MWVIGLEKKIKTYKSNFKSRKKNLNANVKNYEISKVSIIYIYRLVSHQV